MEVSEYLVGSPAFKAGRDGRSPSGGFDSRPPPPESPVSATALQNPPAESILRDMKKLILLIIVVALVAFAVKKVRSV